MNNILATINIGFRLSILLLTMVSWELNAQDIHLSFHHITEQSGLPQSETYFLFQDSWGYMWIGTEGGLLRFDGQNIKKYQQESEDSLSLSENIITSQCFEDVDGNLWFSTFSALNCYRRKSNDFIAFSQKDGLKNYHAFYLEDAQKIWLRIGSGKEGSLHLFDLKTHEFEQSLALEGLQCKVWKNEEGAINKLITTALPNKSGLQLTDLETNIQKEISFQNTSDGRRRNYASPTKGAFVDATGVIWVGVYDGLGRYEIGSTDGIVEMKRAETIDKDIGWIYAIAAFDENRLLVLADKGLLVFDKRTKMFVQQFRAHQGDPYSLQIKNPNNLYFDSTGNIWIAGQEQEIAFAQLGKNKFPSIYESINSNITAIQEDEAGRIWCSSLDSGVYVFNQKKELLFRSKYLKNETIPNQQFNLPPISYFIKDQEEQWWGNMDNYLFLWKSEIREFELKLSYFFGVSSSASNRFNVTYQLQDGTNLIAKGKTIYQLQFEKGKVDTLLWHNLEYLNLNNITAIFQDKSQQIYLGDSQGRLLVLKESNNQLIKIADKRASEMITAFLEDTNRGVIWMATSKGLASMEPNSFDYQLWSAEKDSIPNEAYAQILLDSTGYLWLSSNNGLIRYHPDYQSFHRFNTADGLLSMGFNKNTCFTASQTGEIWAGTKNGINVFKPESIQLLKSKSNVQLTNLLVNDELYEEVDNYNNLEDLEFNFSQNTLSFQFVALEYGDPTFTNFLYQLEGVDKDPVSNGNRGFVRYPNLPKGDYVFKVWANNSDGFWNEKAFELPFYIKPPYYQTWWFYLSCLLVISGIIYAIFQYRLEQALKVERMRVRISSDLHDDVGTLLSGLAMQTELLELTAKEDTKPKLKRIADMSRSAMSRMRDTVWAIDARRDKLEDLLDRLREHAEENLGSKGISFFMDTGNINLETNLSVNIRQQLYLIFKEAITNAAKHSKGDSVQLNLKKQNGQLEMTIYDNGQVEQKSYKTTGLGLSNMKMRAEKIEADLSIDTADGFKISLVINAKMLG